METNEISARIVQALTEIDRIIIVDSSVTEPANLSRPVSSSAHVSKVDSEGKNTSEVDDSARGKMERNRVKLKLSKLVLPKFNGDVTQF